MIALALPLLLATFMMSASSNSCGHSTEEILQASNAEFLRLLETRVEQADAVQAIEPEKQNISLTVYPLRLIRSYRYDHLGYDAEITVGPCLEIIDYYIVRR